MCEATGQPVHTLCYISLVVSKTGLTPWPRRTSTYGSFGVEEATFFGDFFSFFSSQISRRKNKAPRVCTYIIAYACVAAVVGGGGSVWLAQPHIHISKSTLDIAAKLAGLLAWPVCFGRSWCVGDVVRPVVR